MSSELQRDERKVYLDGRLENLTVDGDLNVNGTIVGNISEPFYTSPTKAVLSGIGNTLNGSSDGSATLGGKNNTTDVSSEGGVQIGGLSKSTTMSSSGGAVSIASNTTFSGANNSISIGGLGSREIKQINQLVMGADGVSISIEPEQPNIILNGNAVDVVREANPGVGVISSLQLFYGYLRLQNPGAYTFDTASNLIKDIWDKNELPFLGNERPAIEVIIHNNSPGNITLASGVGMTFYDSGGLATDPYTVPTDAIIRVKFIFRAVSDCHVIFLS